MNIAEYWQYTDLVTKLLFFVLIGLSIASWITGIMRIYFSWQLKKHASNKLQHAIDDKQSQLASLSPERCKLFVEQILLQTIARLRHNSEKGLPLLGTTAAIAPFVGLFGTVWGIFHALHSIGQSGQAGLAQVAGPVGEALIMTGLGLAVAIPAVVFFNISSRMNRNALHQANDTAHQLLADAVLGEPTPVHSDNSDVAK
ncbi:MAG: biopolymer transporter ExbB [Pseudomonadales bacterium]|nr:MAG: biopolymer transporter ExbB [Pseudomonadales bacterium]